MELKHLTDGQAVSVKDEVFGRPYNEGLVHQIVTAFLSNKRAGTKAQKNRSEVSGGGKKPWRQKGTGRARAGSTRSPIWVGGGIHFAAKPRKFTKKVNKKMYRGALKSLLSELVRQDRLVVVTQQPLDKPSSKTVIEQLGKDNVQGNNVYLAHEYDKNIALSLRNVPGMSYTTLNEINPAALVGATKVFVTDEAVKALEEKLA